MFLTSFAFAAQTMGAPPQPRTILALETPKAAPVSEIHVPDVPFYSQFKDITSPKWQKVGCGVTSLAMIIDFYKTDSVSVNTLLKKGIAAGAYDYNAGWVYKGLIGLSRQYGLDGTYYDLAKFNQKTAFAKLKEYVAEGPVMISVHYKFDPKSTVPHLVVVNGIDGDVIYYNDPAEKGEKTISTAKFLKAWKKRVIIFRPVGTSGNIALNR